MSDGEMHIDEFLDSEDEMPEGSGGGAGKSDGQGKMQSPAAGRVDDAPLILHTPVVPTPLPFKDFTPDTGALLTRDEFVAPITKKFRSVLDDMDPIVPATEAEIEYLFNSDPGTGEEKIADCTAVQIKTMANTIKLIQEFRDKYDFAAKSAPGAFQGGAEAASGAGSLQNASAGQASGSVSTSLLNPGESGPGRGSETEDSPERKIFLHCVHVYQYGTRSGNTFARQTIDKLKKTDSQVELWWGTLKNNAPKLCRRWLAHLRVVNDKFAMEQTIVEAVQNYFKVDSASFKDLEYKYYCALYMSPANIGQVLKTLKKHARDKLHHDESSSVLDGSEYSIEADLDGFIDNSEETLEVLDNLANVLEEAREAVQSNVRRQGGKEWEEVQERIKQLEEATDAPLTVSHLVSRKRDLESGGAHSAHSTAVSHLVSRKRDLEGGGAHSAHSTHKKARDGSKTQSLEEAPKSSTPSPQMPLTTMEELGQKLHQTRLRPQHRTWSFRLQ